MLLGCGFGCRLHAHKAVANILKRARGLRSIRENGVNLAVNDLQTVEGLTEGVVGKLAHLARKRVIDVNLLLRVHIEIAVLHIERHIHFHPDIAVAGVPILSCEAADHIIAVVGNSVFREHFSRTAVVDDINVTVNIAEAGVNPVKAELVKARVVRWEIGYIVIMRIVERLDLAVAEQEVIVTGKAEPVGSRIVPGDVDMVVFSVNFNLVPLVIHFIGQNDLAVDSGLSEQIRVHL